MTDDARDAAALRLARVIRERDTARRALEAAEARRRAAWLDLAGTYGCGAPAVELRGVRERGTCGWEQRVRGRAEHRLCYVCSRRLHAALERATKLMRLLS